MIKKILETLKKEEIDGLLITSKQNRYWFSKYLNSSGYLLITEKRQILFLDGRYKTDAKDKVQNVELIIVNDVINDIKKIIEELKIKTLGIEEEYLTINFIKLFEKGFGCKIKPVSVKNFRNEKSEDEITFLKKAASIGDEALRCVVKNFKLGKTEDDLENELFNYFQKNGADKIFPRAVITSGKRGALPHGKPTNKLLQTGELVTIDFGCVYKGYCSDMTRTLAIGQIDSKLKEIYNIVLEAQRLGIETIKPGVKCSDIHKICYDYIDQKGYAKYFVHQTGHGIGIDVHENPRISNYDETILTKGVVFTVEPGIYIPGLGGVRIEDMILVTENGCESLTKLSKNLINILENEI